MPKCKNDPTRKYKGTEPSPKGLGYCAHSMKVGAVKKGKDGNKWIIKEMKNGSKRWIKVKDEHIKSKNNKDIEIDCKKFVSYKKKVGKVKFLRRYKDKFEFLCGIDVGNKQIHKYISYNKFENKITKIPDGFRKYTMSKTQIKEDYCGNIKYLDKNNKEYLEIKKKMKGYKKYKTHWNRERPYLCYVKKNDFFIYKIDKKNKIKYQDRDKPEDWIYTKLVKHYKTKKIFIGKDTGKCNSSNGSTHKEDVKFSIGNTILLQLTKNRYSYIEGSVYEFSTNDEIVKYFSLIGRNDVPYPVALGKKNVYFMLDEFYKPNVYIPRKYFPKKMKDAEFEGAYQLYYNYDYIKNENKISSEAKSIKFKKFKRIDIAV